MHFQHDEVLSVAAHQHGHIVDVHLGSALHDSAHESLYLDDFSDHQYHAEVDVSVDSLAKKLVKLSLTLLLFVVAGFVISLPLLLVFNRHYRLKIKLIWFYYFLTPPLRAPPASFPF